VILDTSFLIDLFDGRDGAFEKGLELSESNTVQRVPSPVVVELAYGAEFGDEKERWSVQNALRMYPVVEQDEQIAHRAGQLLARADQRDGGESGVAKVDPMVAAVSDVYDEAILTDNVEDFRALGVAVETYWGAEKLLVVSAKAELPSASGRWTVAELSRGNTTYHSGLFTPRRSAFGSRSPSCRLPLDRS